MLAKIEIANGEEMFPNQIPETVRGAAVGRRQSAPTRPTPACLQGALHLRRFDPVRANLHARMAIRTDIGRIVILAVQTMSALYVESIATLRAPTEGVVD